MKKFVSLCVSGLTLLISGFITTTFLRSSAYTPPSSAPELDVFTAIRPIDTHAHAFKPDSTFYAMMDRLHLHILDICVANRNDSKFANLQSKINAAKAFVKGS